MKKYIVKHTNTSNIQNDGRKKPIWETYTAFEACLHDSYEDAKHFAEVAQHDSYEIYEATLTLVGDMK